MSWLKDSLNSVKGQITTFASEVLAEGIVEDSNETFTGLEAANAKVQQLEERCRSQDEEIAALKKLNDELQKTLQAERLSRKNGITSREEEASSWFWDPPAHAQPAAGDLAALGHVRALQDEVADLKRRLSDQRPEGQTDELNRLREENANLTANLDDLDGQHQMAMERLLTLKKDLQKNFEMLRREHDDLKSTNDEYANRIDELETKLRKCEAKPEHSDYDTLHHKYVNLERIHSNLKENAEKFQEENQELHEEVFKLQEELAKTDRGGDEASPQVTDMIPRDKYETLLREVVLLQENRRSSNSLHLDETNIDDNAKSVIENLKRDISDLKHKLAYKSEQDYVDSGPLKSPFVEADKLMQMYSKYISFELPSNDLGESVSTGENIIVYKIENALKSISFLKKEIEVLEQNLSEATLNENHLQRQIDDLTSDNEFLSADLQQCERELSEMKKNNDFLLSEITTLKNASKLEPIIEAHEDNIVKLESELADCNKLNKGFESEIGNIEKQLSEVNKEKDLLQTDLYDLREKYNTMLHELDTYKSNAAKVQQLEMDSQIQQSENLRKALEEIDHLKEKQTATASENEKLNINYCIVENEKILLIGDVDSLKHQLEDKINSEKDLIANKLILEQKLEDLEVKMHSILRQKADLEQDRQNYIEKVNILTKHAQMPEEEEYLVKIKKAEVESKKCISEFETKILRHKETENILRAEIESMKKSEKSKVNEKIIELSKENSALLVKIESQYKDLHECQKLNDQLVAKVSDLEFDLQSKFTNTSKLEAEIAKLNSDLAEHLLCKTKLEEVLKENAHLSEIKTLSEDSLTKSREKVATVEHKVEQLSKELKSKNDEIVTLKSTVIAKSFADESKEQSNDTKDEEIKQLNETITELKNQSVKVENVGSRNNSEIDAKLISSLQYEIEELKLNLTSKQTALQDMKNDLELANETLIEHKALLDNLTAEKAELIAYITTKHNENIQYHNEIQRLNVIIMKHAEEHTKILKECDDLKQEAHQNNTECETLRIRLQEKDQKLMELNESINSTEHKKAELSYSTDLIKNLTDKCEDLDKNLTIQLDVVKRLQADKAQLSEREQSLARELDRLRRHLAESEDNHTQELLASEQKLNECQTKLLNIEERAKQHGTVYTSNSIRANQELETLRNQIRLLERQREEAQAQLSEADDANKRSDAALDKLQLVLQQFQSEKDRDIENATEKIRNRLAESHRENEALRTEIRTLTARLEESMNGLKAAARLGDQLETRAAQLAEYKEKVRALEEAARATEQRARAAAQHERVDKGLVKNLLLNYIQTNQRPTDRLQVLRILSTVLDFNQRECERAGLAAGGGASGGATGGAAGGAGGAGQDGIMREFVKFLEKESRPAAPLPSMMALAHAPAAAAPTPASSRSTTPLSRKNSGLGPQPTPYELYGHRRNTSGSNLLLQSAEVRGDGEPPSLSHLTSPAPAQTRDSEGAILKNVLRDM